MNRLSGLVEDICDAAVGGLSGSSSEFSLPSRLKPSLDVFTARYLRQEPSNHCEFAADAKIEQEFELYVRPSRSLLRRRQKGPGSNTANSNSPSASRSNGIRTSWHRSRPAPSQSDNLSLSPEKSRLRPLSQDSISLVHQRKPRSTLLDHHRPQPLQCHSRSKRTWRGISSLTEVSPGRSLRTKMLLPIVTLGCSRPSSPL